MQHRQTKAKGAQQGRKSNEAAAMATLLERADRQGYLTSDDVIDVLSEAGDLIERLEQVLAALHRAGIEVYDKEDDLLGDLGFLDDEDDQEEVDLSDVSSDDTVGLYL